MELSLSKDQMEDTLQSMKELSLNTPESHHSPFRPILKRNSNLSLTISNRHLRNSSDIARASDVSYSDFLAAMHYNTSLNSFESRYKRDSFSLYQNRINANLCPTPKAYEVDFRKELYWEDSQRRRTIKMKRKSPLSTYCFNCRMHVRSEIEFTDKSFIPGKILNVIGSMCCNAPAWLNDLKVHKCPKCKYPL